jgi:hypothetical protein
VALTAQQIQLLDFCEQYWNLHSTVPSEDFCAENGLDRRFYQKAFKNPDFRDALLARGVRIRGVTLGNDPFTKMNALTAEQLTVANVLLDMNDNRSRKKKLTDLGVSSAQLNAWYRDPAFQHYMRMRTEGLVGAEGESEANLALLNALRNGDLSAVKYYNELTGKYRPGAKDDNVDVGRLLQLFIEVIQRHVESADTRDLIAQDLMQIAKGMQAAKSNILGPVQLPSQVGITGGAVNDMAALPVGTGGI